MISLRNLMEEKQLDFTQPLLSVRRFTSTGTPPETNVKTGPEPKIPPLPVYKSELKSGPVRNPGTVPFVWEQTPGKPKDESTTKTQTWKRPPLVPRLPPGRVPKVKQEVGSLDENDRGTVEEMASCKSGIEEEDDDDDEEVYRDANERFSRSESFFLNCSISGVSGLDDSEIKSSGALSMDAHTRSFMMDRFLPAAKAMASETPPHTIRKQTVTIEKPREIKLVANGNRQSQPNLHTQTKHVKEIFMEESEDEDEDDDYDDSGYASTRGCGLLPRLCLKGSLVLLNPVPGMRTQATSVRRVRNSSIKSSKDAANEKRSSHGQGITQLQLEENASKSRKSNTHEGDAFSLYRNLQGPGISNYVNVPFRAVHTNASPSLGCTEKDISSATNECDEPRRRKLGDESGSASPIEKTLYIDSVHKIRSSDSSSNSVDMKGMSYSSDMVDDTSLKSIETKELYILDSATQDFKKLNALGEKNIPRLDDSLNCLITSSDRSLFEVKVDLNYSSLKPELVQDAAKLTISQISNKKKFDLENQFPLKPSSRVDSNGLAIDTATLTSSVKAHQEKSNLDRKQPEKSSYESNNLNIQPEKSSYESNNLNIPEYDKNYDSNGKKLIETSIQDNFGGPSQDFSDQKDSRNQFLKRKGNEDSSQGGYSQSRLPFAPPPPKSPSDSWLKRALPTSSRNTSFLQSSLAMRLNPVFTTASPEPKAESTVKSSDTNSLHLQFSKELLSSIPEV